MKKFKIKMSSVVIHMLTILSVVVGASIIAKELLPQTENTFVILIFTVIVFGGAIYITRFTAMATAEWTISEKDIQIKWRKQFLFQNRPDLIISWNDIQAYKFQPDRNFDLFELKLSNGTFVKLWHNTWVTNDDFMRFVRAFEKRVKDHNEKEMLLPKDISRTKTVYEGKSGITIATILIVCLATLIVIGLTSDKKVNWPGLGVAFSGLVYFLFQVIAYQKKEK